MIISVETATKSLDYDWYSESGASCSTRPRTVITENAASFAFYAERNDGGWSATMFNLWIPEQKDKEGRRIRLSVKFDGLESEAQARALALAYLALPLEKTPSFKYARYSAELAECYGVAEAGSPVLQFDKMRQWAEAAIARADLTKPCTPASSACFAEIDKSAITEIGELQSHLRTYALRDKNGMRILFDDGYVEGLETDVDVIITSCNTGTRIQYTAFIQDATKGYARNTETQKGRDEAKELAIRRVQEIGRDITRQIEEHELTKKWLAGCVVFGIVLVISVLIWSMYPKTGQNTLIVETSMRPLELKFLIQNASREAHSSDVAENPPVEMNLQVPAATSESSYAATPKESVRMKLQIPNPPAKNIMLEIQNEPSGCTLLLNGTRILRGTDGKYSISAQGGILQILPPSK